MKAPAFLASLIAGVFVAACSRQPAPPPSALQARLEAATAITNGKTRDETLATLAQEAAEAKDARITAAALRAMMYVTAKDAAAEKCAVILARRGEVSAAKDIAKSITYSEVRDRTLQAVASGK
jgi:hypothetical protein